MNSNTGPIHYRSVADLNNQIIAMSSRLPRDIEVVVGVPRSGLLAGSLLALHLNLPFTDVEGLIEGRVFTSGARLSGQKQENLKLDLLRETRTALVVDDSVYAGNQFRLTRAQLEAAGLPHKLYYAAVFIRPNAEEHVDVFGDYVPTPRMFEWNFMHHKHLALTCMDIDGVLCRDPLKHENDDGHKYNTFLSCADPLYLPTRPVGWLVTCRLEKYRAQTEAWLARHGVQYGELVMMNHPSQEARRAAGNHGEYKAEVYTRTGAQMFIESSIRQAVTIADLTDKPVLCMDTREMVLPGVRPGSLVKPKLPAKTLSDVLTTAKKRVRKKVRGLLAQAK